MSGPSIHTGFWIDHSAGTVLGSVLTYKANYGNQLITAAALIIALTGSAFWSIVGFIIHQRISQEPNQDELDAQVRVVLRNGGPPDAVTTLLNMGHTWSGRAKGAWKRTILFAMPPLFIFLSFTVAGIVVSYIALSPDSSPALLKAGDICGIVSENSSPSALQSFSNTTIVASAYVRDCYAQDSTGAVACSTFNKPTLPYTLRLNATCPLGTGNCANGDLQAVNMTTYVDSHDDLGINAPASDRIQLAYSVSCAPMAYNLLRSFTNTSHKYGLRTNNATFTFSNVTFASGYTSWTYTNITAWPQLEVGTYTLYPYKSYWPHDGKNSTGIPKAPLNQSSFDVTIALINTNGIRYIGESNDTIFATNAKRKSVIPNYTSLYPLQHQVSAIACTDQWQYCNGRDRCSGWLALNQFGSSVESLVALGQSLGYNAAQNATLVRLVYGTSDSVSIYLSMFTPSPLRAGDYSLGGFAVSSQLPNNQWVIEVETWYQITLAKLQYITKLFANIPPAVYNSPGFKYYYADSKNLQQQCSQQRIQMPPSYQNYSVFGLCFVFAMGLVTLLAAWLLKKYQHKIPGRAPGQAKHDKLLSHQADSYLQLHRAAMELAGHGGWYGAHDGKTEVPYTKKAERVLTQESLTYKGGANHKAANTGPNGVASSSDGSVGDAKVIAGSWNGTGITTIQ